MFRECKVDNNGKNVMSGDPVLFPSDSTIIAVSQGPKDKIVRTTTGLETNSRGLLEVDEKGMTTREGVFSGGDVVLGPRNVVQAVKNARYVVKSMDEYLSAKRG